MSRPDDPPPAPLPLPGPSPLPLTVVTPPPRTLGVPLPPLDESYWRFVFQDDPEEPHNPQQE